MSSPFLAEIRTFPFNFAPRGWALCNGQIMTIASNTSLFSLLGTTYGGNGQSTFGLPNLQGCIAMHTTEFASSTPLGRYYIGLQAGEDAVTLSISNMASHNHSLMADTTAATSASPAGAMSAYGQYSTGSTTAAVNAFTNATPADTVLAATALNAAGSSFPHNNLAPYLTMTFAIALTGVFPERQ